MAFTAYKALDFSGLDKSINAFAQQQQLSKLGQGLDGSPEGYAKAGQNLLALGDVGGATNMFALSEKARERSLGESAIKNSPFNLNRPVPTAPVSPSVGVSPAVAPPAARPGGVQAAGSEADTQRLEAEASGLTQLGDPSQPRGLRNNNPGNIESGRFAATVQGFQGSDGRFAQYATPEQGIQAADKLLTTYAGKGLNTVAGIVNRWAPPTENNTGAYVAQVAKELGVDPNAPLDMSSPEVRQRLIAAKIRVENGRQPYAEDVFQRALNPNWGREVASFEGGGAQPTQTAQAPGGFNLGNAPPQASGFSAPAGPQAPQVAQAPQQSADGLYTNTPTPALRSFIANPRVPDNLRTIMQQELERRQQAPAPVQMAEAAPQPGQPVADVPAQGAQAAQFAIPGPNQLPPNDPRPDISTPQLLEVLANPRLASQHPIAKIILDGRQKYSDENAPDKRAQVRAQTEKTQLETEKLRREVNGEGARPMTPEERQSFGVPKGQPAYMNSKGEPKFGPAGTTVKNEGVIPPGYRALRDADGNLERVEPIPGSKAEQEVIASREKKEKSDRIKAEVGTTVGNALDDIDRLMATATLPTAGTWGARVAAIPGTHAYDISQALTTIGANISFAQLQQMREASPTGGALGAVSDNEQRLLQNSYAALSQSQSPEQFKTNLGRVRATFERIVHGRTLTNQERKTGGPMTMERAKGLREQAQQAIANGAPRDAVLKRLKDDYGISAGGL